VKCNHKVCSSAVLALPRILVDVLNRAENKDSPLCARLQEARRAVYKIAVMLVVASDAFM